MSHTPDRDRGFVGIGALAADYLARMAQHHGRVGSPRPASGIAEITDPLIGAGLRRRADTACPAAVLAGGDPDA